MSQANPIINRITECRRPCVFVSPHIDDALLSCGDLAAYLADKTEVAIVNVFTSPTPGPHTLWTRRYMRRCGAKDASRLFADRKSEEAGIVARLGIRHLHLDLVDAAWRMGERFGKWPAFLKRLVPELGHLYPVHPLHINSDRIAPQDGALVRALSARLKEVVAAYPNAQVFCPIGNGSHVDHLVVREACLAAFSDAILWSDYPYNSTGRRHGLANYGADFTWEHDLARKRGVILGYKSQLYALFSGRGFTVIPERYYYNPAVHGRFAGRIPTVTVGIPAHNEEQGIADLVESIYRQAGSFRLERVVVAADGCTDRTCEVVRSLMAARPNLELVDDGRRLGQGQRLNQLYRMNASDVFVTFDGDSILAHDRVIDGLVRRFGDWEVGLAGGNYVPRNVRTFFDRAVATVHSLWQGIRTTHLDGRNIHNHLGCISALSREFAAVAEIPERVAGTDCYVYAQARSMGHKYAYEPSSHVLIQMPRTLGDFIRQTVRFKDNGESMSDYFGDWVAVETSVPALTKARVIFRELLRHPILVPAALAIRAAAAAYRALFASGRANPIWDQVTSSKSKANT